MSIHSSVQDEKSKELLSDAYSKSTSSAYYSEGNQKTLDTNSVSTLVKDDILEYHIKFPTCDFSHMELNKHKDEVMPSAKANDNDYVMVNNEFQTPVVLLLGWAGCQDRYLMKYSRIYEDRGLITVRYTAPVENLFWKRHEMIKIGEKIVKLIFDMNFDEHPIIFHVFSNGGAFLYQHISLAIRKLNKPVKIQGIIFDSAPGERRVSSLCRAISAIYGRDKPCNYLISLLISLVLMVVWCFEETYSSVKSLFFGTDMMQSNPFSNLIDEETKYPQLFLYSKKDLLIPYQDVEKFAKHRQRYGVQVRLVSFEKAEHVKLYTAEPEVYVASISQFVNSCIDGYLNNESNKKIN